MEPIDPIDVVKAVAVGIPTDELAEGLSETSDKMDNERGHRTRKPVVSQALVSGCLWVIGVCTIIGAITVTRWVWDLAGHAVE
tara:strand:- start:101 stop:349 length:249 start_codon:yes stop_codon:yes gene_type:complete